LSRPRPSALSTRPTVESYAANTPAIHQCSSTACAVARQPLVGGTDPDPCLSRKSRERQMFLTVPVQQPFAAEGCQPRVRVGMHGM
jgi:hypothetical protein